jgi:hypothetical protein
VGKKDGGKKGGSDGRNNGRRFLQGICFSMTWRSRTWKCLVL